VLLDAAGMSSTVWFPNSGDPSQTHATSLGPTLALAELGREEGAVCGWLGCAETQTWDLTIEVFTPSIEGGPRCVMTVSRRR
jgi:hypothetical protein